MSDAWPDVFGSKPLTRAEICAAGVPWWCAAGWVPLLGAPVALSTQCREAYDLERACNAGAFNPNLIPGSGAGKAPPIAAQPGVNYNDAAVLATIAEQQKKSDLTAWLQSVASNMRLMGGDGSQPGDAAPELNFIIVIALGIVIGGAVFLRR